MKISKIELSVIIVSYNTKDLTLQCIKSLKRFLNQNTTELIVIDNNSTDGSSEMLSQETNIKLIQNKINVGFSKANNQGAGLAMGEFLFFLNSDTILINRSINNMVEFLKKHSNIGIVSPKLLNHDLSTQASCFPKQSIINAIKEYIFNVPHSFSKFSPISNTEISVDATVGAAMLIKKSDFFAVGQWDEKYFFYFEDLDLCRKIKKVLKKEIYYYPQTTLIHLHGSSPSGGQLHSWKKLIPSSKIYHGLFKHTIIQGIIYFSRPYIPRKLLILKNIYIVPLLAIIVLPFFPLFKSGIHNIQDDMQFIRILEMKKCLLDFQIPCRWVPDLGYGYGYPLYNYYAPGPYYLGAIFSIIFNVSTIDVVKLLFIFGFISSFATMYLLARRWLKIFPSIFLSVIYLYLPTRMVQVYVRGSLGEFLSYTFFPIIFLCILNIIQRPTTKNIIFLAIANSVLILTHNLMSIFFIPIQLFWLIFNLPQKSSLKILAGFAISLAIGFLLCAFFVVPALFEGRYVHLESLTGGYFGYQQHFVTLKQLFFDNHFGNGSSQLGAGDDLYLGVGIVWLMSVVSLIILGFNKSPGILIKATFLNFLGFSITFLVHEKSSFIWERIKLLQWLQFPWRLNVISSFLFVISTLYSLANIKIDRIKFLLLTIFLAISLIAYGNKFIPNQWINTTDDILFNGAYYQKQLTSSIYDYLPKSAILPPNKPARQIPEVLNGEAKITNYSKSTASQGGDIAVLSPEATIRFPVYDFPGMEVLVNNKVIPHQNNNCLGQDYCFGLISAKLSQGTYYVNVKLIDTPIRTLSNILSISTLLVLAGLLIFINTRNAEVA